jgi:ABC-type sugar transport system substrate-binding protein
MKLLKQLLILTFFMVLVPAITFAGSGTKEEGEKKPVVVLLWLGAQTPYGPPFISNFHFLANEKGWVDIVFDGKFDAALQASQMDDAIAMKPDLIDLVALDAAGMAPGIRKAWEAGIPVLMDHTKANPEDEKYTVGYSGPDNYLEGVACAELMHDALKGKGKVVMIEGAAGQEAQINRAQGFIDRLEELDSKVEILARQTAEWRKDLATQVMQDWIVRYGDEIDGVYGQDDTLAVGAWVALEEAGYNKGDIVIIGLGGSREGLAAVNDGTIYGTVMQSPIPGSTKAIETIKKIFEQGIKPPKQLDPYFNWMDLPKVTKENVEQYLPGDW